LIFDSWSNDNGSEPTAGISSYLIGGGSGGSATDWSGGLAFYTKSSSNTFLTQVGAFDSSGNLGLGVTPSAWGSGYKAFQIAGGSSGNFVNFGGTFSFISFNSYFNGSNYVYQNTGSAGVFDFNGSSPGGYSWRIAASGSAGATPSFTQAMTLNASGQLGIGTTSPSYLLDVQATTSPGIRVKATSSGGAVLTLDATTSTGASPQLSFLQNGSNLWAVGGGNIGSGGTQDFSIYNYTTPGNALTILASNSYVGIGTVSPAYQLDVSGGIRATGNIFHGVNYTNSVSLSGISSGTFTTIVSPGTLSYGNYIVYLQWNHGGSGAPYICSTSFTFMVAYTNGSGTDTAFTPMTVTHTGSGYQFQVRGISAGSASNGIQFSCNWTGNGNVTITCYRIG
jgi:hypothetical protein